MWQRRIEGWEDEHRVRRVGRESVDGKRRTDIGEIGPSSVSIRVSKSPGQRSSGEMRSGEVGKRHPSGLVIRSEWFGPKRAVDGPSIRQFVSGHKKREHRVEKDIEKASDKCTIDNRR